MEHRLMTENDILRTKIADVFLAIFDKFVFIHFNNPLTGMSTSYKLC